MICICGSTGAAPAHLLPHLLFRGGKVPPKELIRAQPGRRPAARGKAASGRFLPLQVVTESSQRQAVIGT